MIIFVTSQIPKAAKMRNAVGYNEECSIICVAFGQLASAAILRLFCDLYVRHYRIKSADKNLASEKLFVSAIIVSIAHKVFSQLSSQAFVNQTNSDTVCFTIFTIRSEMNNIIGSFLGSAALAQCILTIALFFKLIVR